ncbi:SRPBCC family protein [Eleftheria terrae]|uniref:SRPBCC family protein n=1 Tax=Eleftheria terrae TaxID=1597781 RepID=UPI00263A8C0A|nr:SRPBCC family protein [Eleftheria terrae]WKB55684.1 SRPBCC family protein [Eleftheria terrae]
MRARTVQVGIARPWAEVCDYLADPLNFRRWAPWIGASLRRRKGDWLATRSDGTRVKVRFAAPNAYGVADHCVLAAQDQAVFIALRAVPHGSGAEVLLTVLGEPGEAGAAPASWAASARAGLAALKAALERPRQPVVLAAAGAAEHEMQAVLLSR